MRPFDVHFALNHAVSIARSELDNKKILLSLELGAQRSIVVGDEVRIEQAFWNVINNAIKFTPPCGRISIRTRVDGGNLEISVSDSGIGMTSDELKRIFRAFAQGDHAIEEGSRRFGGLGLGLAISQSMIRRHLGSISAKSDGRSRGTTFVIRLPLALERPSSNGHSSEPVLKEQKYEPKDSERPRRILIVEDHEPTSAALANLLRRRRYNVTAATSLADARAALGSGKFDIVISDIGLPDGDACEFMSNLTERDGIVAIAVSGYGMDDDVRRAKAAGFATHMTKPVTADDLDRALGQALTRAT
jgi:CheY-like chemotaxis protein